MWIRHESTGEGRAPLSPADAAELIREGFRIVVEESSSRVFPIGEYEAVGCLVAPADSWPDAPPEALVLGLKELPAGDTPLRDHVYFGSAFAGQKGADQLLRRFTEGGGVLYDLEHLVDDTGHRVAAFSYWAGYVAAALAVLAYRQELPRSLTPMSKDALDELLRQRGDWYRPSGLVLGALGNSGAGACDALRVAGIEPTRWDREETRVVDKGELLDHDIVINAVKQRGPVVPFLTETDLDRPDRRTSVIADVTCAPSSDRNMLPIYHERTTWASPTLELRGGSRSLRLIAIENIATLLPLEATLAYSQQLRPVLATLPNGDIWQRARDTFTQHLPSLVAV
nr:saccharopine dehydrogenase [Kineosphaera limosa]